MGNGLNEIVQELKDSDKKVQLICAFNGTKKTRLSRKFKELIAPKSDTNTEGIELANKKSIYYNAFPEDLFYWDNDLVNDIETSQIQKYHFNFIRNILKKTLIFF